MVMSANTEALEKTTQRSVENYPAVRNFELSMALNFAYITQTQASKIW